MSMLMTDSDTTGFHVILNGTIRPVRMSYASGERSSWTTMCLADEDSNNVVIAWDARTMCSEMFESHCDDVISSIALGTDPSIEFRDVEISGPYISDVTPHGEASGCERFQDAVTFFLMIDGTQHLLSLTNVQNGYYYHAFTWDASSCDGKQISGGSLI